MADRIPQQLYERRPGRVWLDFARSWGLIAAAVAIAASSSSPWVWALAILLIGSQQYALLILLHDGQHGTLLRTKRGTRRLARYALSAPLLMAFEPFRRKHLAHHRHLGTERDPDRYYHRSADKATRSEYLLFLTSLRSGLLSVWGAFRGARSEAGPASGSEEARSQRGDWLLVAGIQVAIALALTATAGWAAYALLWLLPYFVGVYVMQNLRSFAEHASAESDELADAHRLITFRSSRLENFFVAPHNMNYHAEHHLHPQVPYHRLPALRSHLRTTGELDGVEFRDGYVRFALRYWLSLPLAASRSRRVSPSSPRP